MASQKQIDANRRNAQKSTGPRTVNGKARSRLNALRDGLTGQITTLSEPDRAAFEQVKAELIAGFNPQTPMERKLAQAIAWDTWRLDHLRAIEMNVYALGLAESLDEEASGEQSEESASEPASAIDRQADDAPADDLDLALADARTFREQAKRFELMSLYEQRMNRNLHRNLTTLRDLQAERQRNYERDKKEEVLLARFNEINYVPIQASTTPSPNGFIFSNEEIAAAAVRQRFVQAATHRLNDASVNELFGGAYHGFPDTFFLKAGDIKPVPEELKKKINGVAPESLFVRRQTHPEEFGVS